MSSQDPLDAYMAALPPTAPQDATGLALADELRRRRALHAEAGGGVSVAVRNRRFVRMQQMLADGDDFFSDEQMEERAPAVYHTMLGRHLDAAVAAGSQRTFERWAPSSAAAATAGAFSGAAVASARPSALREGGYTASSLQAASVSVSCIAGGSRQWGVVTAEAPPSSDAAAHEDERVKDERDERDVPAAEAAYRARHGLSDMLVNSILARQRLERRGEGSGDGNAGGYAGGAGLVQGTQLAAAATAAGGGYIEEEDDEGDEGCAMQEDGTDAVGGRQLRISVSARRAALLRVMQERFLRGDDAALFNYEGVDGDASLDVSREGEADAEDAYFGGDADAAAAERPCQIEASSASPAAAANVNME
jgi:hypothetical protein